MRLLDPSERPPTLGQLFGSTRWLIVLPSRAPAAERDAWQQLAAGWQQRYPDLEIVDDTDPRATAAKSDLLIAGWQNRVLQENNSRFAMLASLPGGSVTLGSPGHDRSSHSIVRMNQSAGRAIGFLGGANPDSIAQLARKLPHYGSYGMLLFDAQGNNLLKQSSPVTNSILTHSFTDEEVVLKLPRRKPLTD